MPNVMKYLPFLNGKYSVAPNLLPFQKSGSAEDKCVFEIDETYDEYISNKIICRKEDIHKYYLEKNLPPDTIVEVNHFIAEQLIKEYPDYFYLEHKNANYILINKKTSERLQWKEDWLKIKSKTYISLFDALASQVQEDVAVCQLEVNKDWIAALHICSPNHWAPDKKVGSPFDAIHAVVPGMEKTMPHYFKMLEAVVNKGRFTRFAWGISTDNWLNHHPLPSPGSNRQIWNGRNFEGDSKLYLRVEKQNITGFPKANAFLFTIRTYFYLVNSLEQNEKLALIAAVETMSASSLEYKGLTGKVDLLKQKVL